MNIRKQNAFSALPTILLMSAILIEVAVVGVVIANVASNTRFSERLAIEAFGAARAGAQDTILKVIRNKGCPDSLPQLQVGSRTADVTCLDSGNIITIESTGIAFTRKKKVEVKLVVDSITGEVSLQSFREVSL